MRSHSLNSCKNECYVITFTDTASVQYLTVWVMIFMMFSYTHTCLLVELPVLDNEMYHAVKPGLSAYKDNPEEVCIPIMLLHIIIDQVLRCCPLSANH